MGAGTLALVVADPDGGFDVVDARDGLGFAWRGHLGDAAAIASYMNTTYPPGVPAPAWDSLVHEVRMMRIGGEREAPLDQVDPGTLSRMIPESIGGPLDPGLWRPRYGDEGVI